MVPHFAAPMMIRFGSVRAATSEGVYDTFRSPEHPPTVLYDDHLTFEVGDTTFEVHHCRGETDDHSWLFCPDREVLCPGDLFIWCVPNAGNPQKVQRYAGEWAEALRAMASREPELLLPGHGPPIAGAERVQQALGETADYLETLERVLAER